MTREDVTHLIEETGLQKPACLYHKELERFAALVAAHVRETEFKPDWNTYRNGVKDGAAEEREQCAKVCEEKATMWDSWWVARHDQFDRGLAVGAQECADLIRERGEQ